MINPIEVHYFGIPIKFINNYEEAILTGIEQRVPVWHVRFLPPLSMPAAVTNPLTMPTTVDVKTVALRITKWYDPNTMIHHVHVQADSPTDQKLMETHYGRYRKTFKKNYCDPFARTHRSAGRTTAVSPVFAGVVTGGSTGPDIPDSRKNPPERAGVVAGEIIGIRGWWVIDGYLRSLAILNVRWEPGATMKGDVENNEGVHAFKQKQMEDLKTYISECQFLKSSMMLIHSVFNPEKGHELPPVVWGQVKLWGDVVEHELGYRAEFAKIVSLKTDEDEVGYLNDYELWQLKKRYGV